MNTPEDERETRAAIRLVALLSLLTVVIYAAVASSIGPTELFTRYGLRKDVHFVLYRTETLDRDAKWGDLPVVWLLGSSIVRESFDAEALIGVLENRGQSWGVEKLAFDRGGPIFTQALTRRLDIRPGDLVVTQVSYDHFRRDWLTYHEGFDLHLQLLLEPDELMAIESLPVASRIEYSLASLPPRPFWQWREVYQEGLTGWWQWGVGLRKKRPTMAAGAWSDPFQHIMTVKRFRELGVVKRNELPDEDVQLEAGQVNHDALVAWIADVQARGATPWVLHVPHHPEYYERFILPATVERVKAHLRQLVPCYVPLQPGEAREYMDYKHPNVLGRPRLTRELADAIVAGDAACEAR